MEEVNNQNNNIMGKINSFEDLIVWQKAIDLSVGIYRITAKFPKEEVFGLTSQIRRASNSVSLNIAEGSVKTTRSYINHLIHARGSASEVLSAGLLANKLDFIPTSDVSLIREMVAEETRMINTITKSLQSGLERGTGHSSLSPRN
jgi:four helix bundle protein